MDLGPGRYVIGRGSECDVVVASGHASRQHARIVVDDQGAVIEDLGAANGTFVNGSPLRGRRTLADSDFIVIGDVVLEIAMAPEGTAMSAPSVREPMPSFSEAPEQQENEPRLSTIPARAFEVLEATADPFFVSQQLPIAEKVLEGWLVQVLTAVKTGAPREEDGDEAALRQGARLSRAMISPRWLDYCVELGTVLRMPLGYTELDSLEPVVFRVGVSAHLLDAYLTVLHSLSPTPAIAACTARVEKWRAYAAPR